MLRSLTGIEKYAFVLGNETYYELNNIIMDDIRKRIELISPLNEQEQMALVDSGDPELLLEYLDKRALRITISEETEIRIAKSGNVGMLTAYIEREGVLCDRAEVELAKTNNAEMIKAYLEYNELCDEAEVELVKLGNEEIIEAYVTDCYCSLSDNAEVELVRLGNKNLLDLYTKHWALGFEAEDELKKLKAKAE